MLVMFRKKPPNMSIKTITSAVIITVATLVLAPATANAQEFGVNTEAPFFDLINFKPRALITDPEPPAIVVKPPERKPDPKPAEPIRYQVKSGDNLTKIAEAHSTSWLRLWYKNVELTNPDLILIDQVILIPAETEQLAVRAVPERVVEQLVASTVQSPAGGAQRGSVAGNTYGYGYCTWFVKNKRPDLPNNLGNANTWYSRAAGMGYAVGSTPRAGAVGTTTRGDLGHVVYVERVNGDGTILISEMNYQGWNVASSRTANASEFVYIY